MRSYGRNAAGAVRDEVKSALAKKGIDVDRQTLVIFEVLLEWEGKKATEIGPYVGSGGHLSGTAWVYDDQKLDPRSLGSKAPGGYYHGPCSLGEFNSHYIGGVAHELGHAFGLPHDCERKAERARRGLSLMGGGNHTYGRERRGEGPGTFLSAASAMLLAHSRPFAGEQPEAASRPHCRLAELNAQFRDGKLILTGAVDARPPAFGIAAFDDWAKIPGDYDAVSWTCDVDDKGRFQLLVGEMRPGSSQLRLKVCHASGATATSLSTTSSIPRDSPTSTCSERPSLERQLIENGGKLHSPPSCSPARRAATLRRPVSWLTAGRWQRSFAPRRGSVCS